MAKARQDDTGKLKTAIVSYLPLDPAIDVIAPPIIANSKIKSDRGFHHPFLCELLIPLTLMESYKAADECVSS